MIIGQRISQRRKALGISAEKLADLIGVSPATIYRYENGDIEKIPTDRLSLIAKALSTTPYKLQFGFTIGTQITQAIAHNISHHRTEAGLSTKQFADVIGVDEDYVLGLESGQIKLEQDVLYKICDALRLIPSNFLSRDEEFSEDEEYLLSRRENAPAPKGERLIDNRNVLRIAGRDGSYIVKVLTDEQMKAFITMVDHLPDAYDDL